MKAKSKSRRAFLITASAGSAGAVAAAVALKESPGPQQAAAAPDAKDGYRDSEHIRKYYKTTEV